MDAAQADECRCRSGTVPKLQGMSQKGRVRRRVRASSRQRGHHRGQDLVIVARSDLRVRREHAPSRDIRAIRAFKASRARAGT